MTNRYKPPLGTILTLVFICALVPCIVIPTSIAIITDKNFNLQNSADFLASLVTILFSTLAFIFSLATFWISREDRHQDKVASIHDDFWFRQIVVPYFWKPYTEFLEKYEGDFNHHREKLDYDLFAKDNILLRDKLSCFSGIDKSIVIKINDILDGLESYVAHEINGVTKNTDRSGEVTFSECNKLILEVLKVVHEKNLRL